MASNSGTFQDGRKGNGRPKGSPNKITRTVRETVLAAFQELQEDPKVKITEWAKREPTEFYKIASRLIPTEVVGNLKNTFTIQIKKNGQPDLEGDSEL